MVSWAFIYIYLYLPWDTCFGPRSKHFLPSNRQRLISRNSSNFDASICLAAAEKCPILSFNIYLDTDNNFGKNSFQAWSNIDSFQNLCAEPPDTLTELHIEAGARWHLSFGTSVNGGANYRQLADLGKLLLWRLPPPPPQRPYWPMPLYPLYSDALLLVSGQRSFCVLRASNLIVAIQLLNVDRLKQVVNIFRKESS